MPKCSVPDCDSDARFEVLLYDVYISSRDVFAERDSTCPYLCGKHMAENETNARGERRPRGVVSYPYSNRHRAQGFTIYKQIDTTPNP